MKKAIIIDDDELDLELLRTILSHEGYEVFSTADGPQGVMLYEHHRPALVFLDIGLPSMSGIEVLEQIRRRDQLARVVVITGYGTGEALAAAKRLGALEFIEKSWDVEVLANRITAALHALP